MGDRRVEYRVGWGCLMERDHLEDLGLDGVIMLKWTDKWNRGRHGLG
jgi:aryl carrier-like protein